MIISASDDNSNAIILILLTGPERSSCPWPKC
jgi:hypothetical protein